MPRKKTKRKTRVTKKAIRKQREELKKTSYQRKKRVIPGPWTNIETDIQVEVGLRHNNTGVMSSILGPSYGSYSSTSDWNEGGWYPIVFNMQAPNLKELIDEHGQDKVMAACEKSLNAQKDKTGKPKYGKVVLLSLGSNNLHNKNPDFSFISVRAKTNKKHIEGFRAVRKGELITIGQDK